MKLNNHGFGMRDMIIYLCVLLLFLLIAVYSINSFYKTLEKDANASKEVVHESQKEDTSTSVDTKEEPVDYNYYYTLEEKLKEATLSYMHDYPYDLSSSIEKVTSGTLINLDYIDPMMDQFGNNTCSGYSNVYQDMNQDYVLYTYISCSNYTTDGY